MGGDRIKFHYSLGDYNNSLKILSHKPKLQIHPWFSHKYIEKTLVYLDKSCRTLQLPIYGAHTEKKLILFAISHRSSCLLHLYLSLLAHLYITKRWSITFIVAILLLSHINSHIIHLFFIFYFIYLNFLPLFKKKKKLIFPY